MIEKQPFDIALALSRIREKIRHFPKAALFELADAGYRSPFEQLVACIISIRTRDETIHCAAYCQTAYPGSSQIY